MFNNGCLISISNNNSFSTKAKPAGLREQAELEKKVYINQIAVEKTVSIKDKIDRSYDNDISLSKHSLLTPTNKLKPQIPDNTSTTPKKTKVLLVEDDLLIQCIHQRMLLELGCTIDIAGNAAEALTLAKHTYDFILLDIGLPDLDGIEVAKKIRNYPNHINTRIFALTANTDPLTEKCCLEAGILRVLHKPIDLNTLGEWLRDHNPKKEELS